MIAFLCSNILWAGVPYTEEELQEFAELHVIGEIIESSCLSHSIDEQGIETYMGSTAPTTNEVYPGHCMLICV